MLVESVSRLSFCVAVLAHREMQLEVKETTGVLPPMAEAGVEEMAFDAESGGRLYAMAAAAPAPAKGYQDKLRRVRGSRAEATSSGFEEATHSGVSSVQAQTRERQVGDLFEYGIEKPVTVRRNQSALVAFAPCPKA